MIYAPTAKRIRRVFGRRSLETAGGVWLIELRRDGVHVRRKRRRVSFRMSLEDVVDAAVGQEQLKFRGNGDGLLQ